MEIKNNQVEGSHIVLYQPDETISLEVKIDQETVWINRQQMSELFDRDIKTIGKHIRNALSEELSLMNSTHYKNPVVAKIATTATDGKTYHYLRYSDNSNMVNPHKNLNFAQILN